MTLTPSLREVQPTASIVVYNDSFKIEDQEILPKPVGVYPSDQSKSGSRN